MKQITKDDLRQALRAWEIAREKALLETDRHAVFLKNRQEVIRLMRENGWTYAQAVTDVEAVSNDSGKALQAASQEMDDRCNDYMKLEAEWMKQQQQP
ncbi:hypothetical protein [Massilia luteola]|uniref:hypothetical protein n=1 Tax=Massilia luteola TaxID=3081751 RepID=UPI002ACBF528|nr:hypothetical protein [Massilia sp. Gc5]